MNSRWLKILGAALLACAIFGSPAYAQRKKGPEPQKQAEQGKPVVQYIVLTILLAIPFGLVCRSSRRM